MDDLKSGPWFIFPATCTHGCGTYYTWDQIRAARCITPDHHHDFSFPRNGGVK